MYLWIVVAIAVTAYLYLEWRNRKAAKAERDAKPPVTTKELNTFLDSLEAARLPMAALHPVDGDPSITASRIGGPLWSPEETQWPSDEDGNPMLLAAQLNFAEFNGLNEFPDKGILQVFLQVGEDGQLKWLDPHEGFRVRWFPEPSQGVVQQVPERLAMAKRGMFRTEQARQRGVALRSEVTSAPANSYIWPYSDREWELVDRNPADDDAAEMLGGWEERMEQLADLPSEHWVGGHPSFTQEDVRHDPELHDLDRVILHLGFDKHVCMGDAGELNLMIAHKDLLVRDFAKAYCTWDCT